MPERNLHVHLTTGQKKVDFVVNLDDKKEVDNFQKIMDTIHSATNDYIDKLAKELDIPVFLAESIWYIRTRSRWTPEHEERILRAYREHGYIIQRATMGEETDELNEMGY